MTSVIDTNTSPFQNAAATAARVTVSAKVSWTTDGRPAEAPQPGRAFDPRGAGRRAVERHGEALRRLAD